MAQSKPQKKDFYQGQLDPYSKKRHGKGTYIYNSFFRYQGQWVENVKQGHGLFKLANGTTFEGHFQGGELNGQFNVTYSDGAYFKGRLENGLRHGYGQFKSMFQQYQGHFKNGRFHGKGKLKDNFCEIQGQFFEDKPHGWCIKKESTGSVYEGQMEHGIRNGKGKFNNQEKFYAYQGQFSNDEANGQGYLKSQFSRYEYRGSFLEGRPKLLPNVFLVQVAVANRNIQPVLEFASKTAIDYQLQQTIFSIKVRTMFQGADELDPLQPTPQEIQQMIANWQKQNKKNKNPPPMPNFNSPRMKKVQPLLVKQQSGRKLRLSIVNQQGSVLRTDYREQIGQRRSFIQNAKSEQSRSMQQVNVNQSKDKKKDNKKKQSKGPAQIDTRINLYKESQSKPLHVFTSHGQYLFDKLQFPDDFPPGKYFLQVKDVSNNPWKTCPDIRLQLIINAKGADPKKKKK